MVGDVVKEERGMCERVKIKGGKIMMLEINKAIDVKKLVEVLKSKGDVNKVGNAGTEVVVDKELVRDAASTIETLLKENERLQKVLSQKNECIADLAKQNVSLNESVYNLEVLLEECEGAQKCKNKQAVEHNMSITEASILFGLLGM